MRLAHKRKVQAKLQKRTKAAVVKAVATPKKAKPVAEKVVAEKTVAAKPAVEKAVAAENLSLRRLYLNAVLAGADFFPDEANLRLAFAGDQDIVTQNMIDLELQKLEETL